MLQDTICDVGNPNVQSFTILVLEGYGLISTPAQEADLGVASGLNLMQNEVLAYNENSSKRQKTYGYICVHTMYRGVPRGVLRVLEHPHQRKAWATSSLEPLGRELEVAHT